MVHPDNAEQVNSAANEEAAYQSQLNDAARLARRIADGERTAEGELVRLYEPAMRRILRTRTDRPADIDDLVNQVWLLVLPKLRHGELKDPQALPAYLNTFTRRVAQNYLRGSHRKTTATNTELVEAQVTSNEGPYARLKWLQAIDTVHTLLKHLSTERDRIILERFFINEEDKAVICAELELDAVQFNKTLYRARKRFKELAGPYLLDYLDHRPRE